MQDFRQLLVWKRAHAFALSIRRATQAMPRTGYTDLKSQMTRAAQSIVDNIVEGCGAGPSRQNPPPAKTSLAQAAQKRFYETAQRTDARGPWH